MNFQKIEMLFKTRETIYSATQSIPNNKMPFFAINHNLSLIIPRVFPQWIDEEKIVKVFLDLRIGNVYKVDIVRMKNTGKNHPIYKAFIYFANWFDNQIAYNIQQRIYGPNKQARVVYDDPWYWTLFENTSPRQSQELKSALRLHRIHYENVLMLQEEYEEIMARMTAQYEEIAEQKIRLQNLEELCFTNGSIYTEEYEEEPEEEEEESTPMDDDDDEDEVNEDWDISEGGGLMSMTEISDRSAKMRDEFIAKQQHASYCSCNNNFKICADNENNYINCNNRNNDMLEALNAVEQCLEKGSNYGEGEEEDFIQVPRYEDEQDEQDEYDNEWMMEVCDEYTKNNVDVDENWTHNQYYCSDVNEYNDY